jgi:hypothetical protein
MLPSAGVSKPELTRDGTNAFTNPISSLNLISIGGSQKVVFLKAKKDTVSLQVRELTDHKIKAQVEIFFENDQVGTILHCCCAVIV